MSAVSANVLLVNGWADVKDHDTGKTRGAGLTLTPSPKASFTANQMSGPEQPGNDADDRGLLDLVATLKPTDRVTVGLNLEWGT